MVVFMQRFNVCGCQKTVSDIKCYLLTTTEHLTYLSTSTSAQRITISNFPLILDKFSIMIVMQKLKFMQEFAFSINVQCLDSSLQAKQLMHICSRAKYAKTCFWSIEINSKVKSS